MVDFVEAVKRPLRADPVTIVLGVLFAIFPPTRPLLHGLGIELSRRTFHQNDRMPMFDDFVDSFLSGLIVFVIAILFFLPALLVLLFGAAASLPLIMEIIRNIPLNIGASVQGVMFLAIGGAIIGSIALFLFIIAAIMLPVGVQLYAHDKRVSSAFSFEKILRVVGTAKYWISWILMIGYGIVLVGIVTLLSLPEFNALSVVFLGIASYLWWMTLYIVMSETVRSSGVLGNTRKSQLSNSNAPARKLKKRKKK
ncbi:MAG: DUF4013 domain-containing protein [Candidatus Diapherotrites archaeon]